MSLPSLLCIAFVALLSPVSAQDVDVRAEFVRLAAEANEAEVRALWAAHPGRILVSIDEDLEGSLSTWEASPEAPDEAAIATQHERALWGARLATEVTGLGIFIDYTSAFVGWDADQKRSFRAGQAAFGRARQAMGEGDWQAALDAGRECTERALPLGDWWGSAMGLSVEARALLALEQPEAALAAASRSRLLYQQLGLGGSELGALDGMLSALEVLGRTSRALSCADSAISLAERVADAERVATFVARRDALRR